jgi:hypothetical protein
MRKTSSSHWDNLSDLEGLLFFAQTIDEMLFEYTLDSYKPMALNCRLLCIECVRTIGEVRDGYMPKKNLQSVLEELKWSLDKDLAAKEILGKKFNFYINQIKPSEIKLNELENIVKFIYNHFSDRKYLEQLKLSLTDLVKNGNQKEKIRTLTSSYLTELINYGYHPNHIDYQNYHFFFDNSKGQQITEIEKLQEFFALFNFESSDYTVVFIGSILFREFKETLNKHNIVVTKTYNCFSTIPADLSFRQSRKSNESFIICTKVNGLDHHSARENIEKFLGQATNLFNFFHHKEKPKINDICVVSKTDTNYVVVIDKPVKSILKTKYDEYPNEAAKSVEKVLFGLKLNNESTYRFSRSIDLHSAALTSAAIENQMLDLWAALETLIPKSTESNKDRIVQICDQIIPFLQIKYIEKHFVELYQDLKSWNFDFTKEILEKTKGYDENSMVISVAALTTLKENKELRLEIYEKLDDYPLLKNRIYSIHKMFNSPKNIKKVLTKHNTKINWHLRRIYRTRSLIIHSGSYPTFTPILIEHLHNYLDIFINKVIELASEERISTIEQAIFEITTQLNYYEDLLDKHQDEELNIDNFKEALLGME